MVMTISLRYPHSAASRERSSASALATVTVNYLAAAKTD